MLELCPDDSQGHRQSTIDRVRGPFLFDSIVKRLGQGFGGEGQAPLLHDDSRQDYGERRCQATGVVDGKMIVVIFTIREGSFRIISARRANSRERRKYAKDL